MYIINNCFRERTKYKEEKKWAIPFGTVQICQICEEFDKFVKNLSRIDHNFLDMRPFSTRRTPLERAHRQLSNGFCLVEKDLISRKLGHILGNDKNRYRKICQELNLIFCR